MLARTGPSAAGRPRPAARLSRAWRPASARRTGCSRRATAAPSAGRTSSSASSRRTAGRETEKLLDGLEIVPAPAGRVPRRRRRGDGHRRDPRPPARRSRSSTSWPTPTCRARRASKRWEDVERPPRRRDPRRQHAATSSTSTRVADAVATITGAPVNERIPDEVLAAADEVELVDMSPHALRQRMRHGNVYPPDRARRRARPVLHRVEPDRAARARRCGSSPVASTPSSRGSAPAGRPSRVSERVLVLVDDSRGDAAGPAPRAPRPRPSCARRSSRSSSRRRRMRRRRPRGSGGSASTSTTRPIWAPRSCIVEAADVAEGRRPGRPHPTRDPAGHAVSCVERPSSGVRKIAAGRSDPATSFRRSRSRSWRRRATRPTRSRWVAATDRSWAVPSWYWRVLPKYGLAGAHPHSYALPRSGPDPTPGYPRDPDRREVRRTRQRPHGIDGRQRTGTDAHRDRSRRDAPPCTSTP